MADNRWPLAPPSAVRTTSYAVARLRSRPTPPAGFIQPSPTLVAYPPAGPGCAAGVERLFSEQTSSMGPRAQFDADASGAFARNKARSVVGKGSFERRCACDTDKFETREWCRIFR